MHELQIRAAIFFDKIKDVKQRLNKCIFFEPTE